MGSPHGQPLEDTHVALVSCPPPHGSMQGSQQVGSAAQKYIVEVGGPLLVVGRSEMASPWSCFICLKCPVHPSLLPTFASVRLLWIPPDVAQMPLPLGSLLDLPRQSYSFPPLGFHSTLFIL